MEETRYNITNNEFEEISKLAQEIYNISVIVRHFCVTQPEVEECYSLAPITEYMFDKADLLNSLFIDRKMNAKNIDNV